MAFGHLLTGGLFMFRVLSPAPKTEKTGEFTQTPEGKIHWHRVTEWPHLGYAESMEEAREKFGGRPVLEWAGKLQ